MARRSDNLRYELRAAIREAIWLLNRHDPGPARDIVLHTTRRGGSTWLMEVIGANRGVKALDQPFEILSANLTAAQFRAMPKFDTGMVIHLDEDDEAPFAAFVDRVLDGSLPVNAPTRFWQRDFDFRSDRLVLKVMAAKGVIDWIDGRYDVETVYLTRNPLALALSCLRNGWTLTSQAYLRNPWFVREHLGEDLLGWCYDVHRHGAPLDRFVLNWGLENLVPLRLLPERPAWHAYSYEGCVLEPEATIDRLAETLDLPDRAAMLRKVSRPSSSSRISTNVAREAIATGDRERLVRSWESQVAPDDRRRAFEVLERLGIDAYRPGEVLPRLRAASG